MAEYNHLKIEKKWQKEWEKRGIYYAQNKSKKPKYYSLIEFPYPSGDGLHVGHPRPYIGMDIISRKRRLQGFNVLYPIGWDAFGLPTENYAIKTGLDPRIVTKKNSDTFRRQIKSLGISFDWSREINTTDSKYYKWTQWIFLQFLKKSLAYKEKMTINWCPKDKIGLANEEVVNGCCERCGTSVEKREKEQWMLAITKYADRLYKDLDDVDYLPQIKLGQRNWIGKSEGAEINFQINSSPISQGVVKIFTTRPDTIFGATYLVLAPEHKLVQKLKPQIANWNEVEKYIKEIKNKIDIERTGENKAKTGIELKKIKAINPATKKEIPVWIADYILVTYGTGAIMAVPAHDERDFEFAKKYNLEIKEVIEPLFVKADGVDAFQKDKPFFERDAVVCVIKHWSENKYLCLNWKKIDWRGFVVGGIESGEKIEDTALREIQEETGYQNIKFIRPLPLVHSKFFQPVKKINRFAHFHPVYVELIDGKRNDVAQREKDLHEAVWLSKQEVEKSLNRDDMKTIWKFFKDGECFSGLGLIANSGKFNGLDSEKAKKEIIKFVGGKEKTTFKLRDWIFSRQRYWGEPIPVIHCRDCGIVPVPEKDLPVKLPKVKNYQPTDSGESPLANISKWVNTKCPKCNGKARRETDTMPNWAGSSWYYLRYTDSKNDKEFASKKNLEYWLGKKELGTPTTKWKSEYQVGGVDWYNGGNEHTTLHLLYSRFWHKFLYDLKLVPTSEPYMKRTSHGMILGEGGVKMSKSLGNVINPDDIVKTYGADTLRIYEMFMGPFDQSAVWSTESIIGARRFIEKVWRIGEKVLGSRSTKLLGTPTTKLLHKTIKKVSEDIEEMRFNTAISSMMILATEIESAFAKGHGATKEDYKKFLQIFSPFAPHITEELWSMLGEKSSINLSNWPKWDENLIKDEEVKIVVQINGKVRVELMIPADLEEKDVRKKALANEVVLRYVAGKNVKKVIYVKNRLVNIVI